jgi:hypothetical protein
MWREGWSIALVLLLALSVGGCITTSMQGYADRELPARPVQRIVAYVAAQEPLATSMRGGIIDEAKKRGIIAQDAFLIFPPARTYSDGEIRGGLKVQGVDGILAISVGDTGVTRQYAGTLFQGQSTTALSADGTVTRFGNMSNLSLSGTATTSTTATATPMYRYQ